jgi:hypothetical protein
MPEPKTKVNDASVDTFLRTVQDAQIQKDCRTIVDIMQAATKAPPKMWGSSIVGFGTHTIVYAGGREADWMMIGFAPRKQNIALYGLGGFEQYDRLLTKLGKHDKSKGCLYVKRLSDVDLPTFTKIVSASVKKKTSPARPKRS